MIAILFLLKYNYNVDLILPIESSIFYFTLDPYLSHILSRYEQ